MLFSKKHSSFILDNHPNLKLGGISLVVHSYKYLGVTISDDLRWESYINAICNSARQLIGLFCRHLYNWSCSELLLCLYKSIICPLVEYCSVIWDLHSSFLITWLDNVEKFALREFV